MPVHLGMDIPVTPLNLSRRATWEDPDRPAPDPESMVRMMSTSDNPSSVVRTRFAPSPTGFLHIGGVRTALFNWLTARHHGGQFILRIDDTDQQRNVEEAVAYILDGFRWLGMDWDEGPEVDGPHAPYYQSQRGSLYQAALERLIAGGYVYRDYSTDDERKAMRESAEREKRAFRFRNPNYTEAQLAGFEAEGRPFAWRFVVPPDRDLVLDDLVRGEVPVNTRDVADFVVARADGSPLYNFASVVDDAEMAITHVIRAEEHLNNTFPQILLFEALGYTLPRFAHVPFVAKPGTKKKMSKRDGFPTGPDGKPDPDADPADNFTNLAYYRERGYLAVALMNYLARLGWSYDDKQELFGRDELIEKFDLDRVIDSPAAHDEDKLFWIQGEKMRDLADDAKVDGVLPYLIREGLVGESPDEPTRQRILAVIAALSDRLKTFPDILNLGRFFFQTTDQITYEPKAVDKRLKKEGVSEILERFDAVLAEVEPFQEAHLESVVHSEAESLGAGMGKVVNAIRVAVTGQGVGPGLYECLVILGRQECRDRIARTRAMLQDASKA